MANGLTGDFDAVLQVSSALIQRLLAFMHANNRQNKGVPTLPHLVGMRLDAGDVHGTVNVQVGVPVISLHHRSSDTFHLELGIRARFTADEGAEDPLPEYINGTVGADYVMEAVDPTCSGWEHAARDHVWLRVVPGSVSFDGSTHADLGPVPAFQDDSPENHRRVRDLVELLLKTQFEATPHQVASGFAPGRFRELVGPRASVLSIPIGLDGGLPGGSVESLDQIFLRDQQLALAISRDVIVQRVQDVLDGFKAGFGTTVWLIFKVTVAFWDVVDVDITWGVRVYEATATWAGVAPNNGGVYLDIAVHGGGATQKAEYNWTFDVAQRVLLKVNASSGWVSATAEGAPTISLNYDGPYADEAKANAAPQVTQILRDQIGAVLQSASTSLGLQERANQFQSQLVSLDPMSDVSFGVTYYQDDGLVIGGYVTTSSDDDQGAIVEFEKLPGDDGYSALSCWMPGGTVDRFHWGWTWADGSRPEGEQELEDRWVLRRPPAVRGPFGRLLGGAQDLPGLDGAGKIKLTISGRAVDREYGDLEDFVAMSEPLDYTLQPGTVPEQRVTVTTVHAPTGEEVETSIVDAITGYGTGFGTAHAGITTARGTNTLVVRPGTATSTGTAAAMIAAGLRASTREGVGMQVVVVHPEGRLGAAELATAAQEVHGAVGDLAATYVSEDVDGTWASALALPETEETTVALVTPTGGTSWLQTGDLDASALGQVLDERLVPAPPPSYQLVQANYPRSTQLLPWVLAVGTDAGCPAPPVGRTGTKSIIAFLRAGRGGLGTTGNRRVLDAIHGYVPDGSTVATTVVVHGPAVDGSVLRDAGIAGDVNPLADPDGVLAARFGIRTWPTTVLVDERGVVSRVLTGVDTEDRPAFRWRKEAAS